MHQTFSPNQLGCAIPKGAEAIVHATRFFIDHNIQGNFEKDFHIFKMPSIQLEEI